LRSQFLSLFFLFPMILHAQKSGDLCVKTEAAYMLGDYTVCSHIKLREQSDKRCKYVKALCCIGNSEYDAARLILTELAAGNADEISALSVNSLTELEFMKGDYKKAQELANQTNRLFAGKGTGTYPYIVSELLLVKSYFNSQDALSALRRIEMIKTLNTDGFIYESLNTNIH
jgi:hypothetical protein